MPRPKLGPSNNPWFRMHHKVLNDPIVQRLDATIFKAYINMLCLAASRHENGNLGDADSVAFALHVDVASCCTALHELIEKGLVATEDATLHGTLHGTFHIPQWAKMQYKSDTSTERSRKHRASKKEACNATGNVSATSHATPQRQIRTETETDIKKVHKKEIAEAIGEGFDVVYAAYPKRAKKPDSLKAWGTVCAKCKSPDEVVALTEYIRLEIIKRIDANHFPEDKQFIGAFGPWLRAESWNDEIIPRTDHGKANSGSSAGRPARAVAAINQCAKLDQELADLIESRESGGADDSFAAAHESVPLGDEQDGVTIDGECEAWPGGGQGMGQA